MSLMRNVAIIFGAFCSVSTLVIVVIGNWRINVAPLSKTIHGNTKLDCLNSSQWSNKLIGKKRTYIDQIWGSFSPGIYFGMKTMTAPFSLATGITWSSATNNVFQTPRHNTYQDEIDKFEWTIHDGRRFGIEHIVDSKYGLEINATFVMPQSQTGWYNSHDRAVPTWIQEFSLSSLSVQGRKSFIYYFGVECSDPISRDDCLASSKISELTVLTHEDNSNALTLLGYSASSGWFSLHVLLDTLPDISIDTTSNNSPVDEVQRGQAVLSFCGLSDVDIATGLAQIARDAVSSPLSRQGDPISSFDHSGDLRNEAAAESTFVAVHLGMQAQSAATVTVMLFEHIEGVSTIDELAATVCGSVENGQCQKAVAHSVFSDTAAGSPSEQVVHDVKKWSHYYSSDFHRRLQEFLGGVPPLSAEYQLVAQRALSAVLGGIGYFHGSPLLGDGNDVMGALSGADKECSVAQTSIGAERHPLSLLSGTPSRSVFPRGFLWDEGFHQLLVSQWDVALTQQVISDWLNAMYFPSDCAASEDCVGGWIPREMILGAEALRRVPEEFVTQRVNVANPPTFLLVVDSLLAHFFGADQQCGAESEKSCAAMTAEQSDLFSFLARIYPQLHQWVQWFLISQKGSDSVEGSFRWRGRSLSDSKVIPNTLASGLDDYPRSPLPSTDEHHVDLHCWMVTASAVMARLEAVLLRPDSYVMDGEAGRLLANNAESKLYERKHKYLLDRLNALHWSEQFRGYYDVGLNSENSSFAVEIFFKCAHPATQAAIEVSVPLEVAKSGSGICPSSHPQVMFPIGDGNGGYKHKEVLVMHDSSDVRLRHIPRVGYVSLFPLLLKHIDAHSQSARLGAVLDSIEDPQQLWTEHGLRSISRSDKFYNKRNSPGDAPYWRYVPNLC